jgi:PemK-like, MazF-like toxin of type II toxin-antitoxin system
MKPGDVVLAQLPTPVPGTTKVRPALILAQLLGPYQTLLLCGISTKHQQIMLGWDEQLTTQEADFVASGLHRPSVIRLSYLRSVKPTEVQGIIGNIDPARLDRLRTRLADQVRP